MNDPKLSEIISKMVTESLPALLDEFEGAITDLLSPLITNLANKALENKTISDLINGTGKYDEQIELLELCNLQE